MIYAYRVNLRLLLRLFYTRCSPYTSYKFMQEAHECRYMIKKLTGEVDILEHMKEETGETPWQIGDES